MCYSAQVIQNVRKFYRELGIRLDYAEATRLFAARLEDPRLNISRGFEANFDDPVNEQEREIKTLIDTYRAAAASQIEAELFAQKTRRVRAERALATKETQRAREDLRISMNKIEALTTKLSDVYRYEPKPRDSRIFPMVYAGVIIRHERANLLSPMRYFCRPAGKPAFYDKKYPGLYNARRDNLEKFWAGEFGHHHAIMVVEAFYENVQLHAMEHRELATDEKPRNVVLQFLPQPPQAMYIACLWSHWTGSDEPSVRGFAAITDEPPAEVAAAGHDRCIINLKPEHVEAWLTPEKRSPRELQEILSDRAVPVYRHAKLEAA
jgi:putative SOS response-associated peptidase YedK